ncbi:unnamed protein product (macronuclear) [Paramecium tetraurelia]|uniref:Uncharacterized protein n=1 Tax=Paramecium tetraurelia TaxID=5888 RepID=A0E5G6_PARTE|nr:uncharacterized protein GSPATT00003394001 [Paramecium tetraurelia]CAK90533.1 unnamed protein product [Paramecium tetraurelia]|eukprot:XP_001457930.1 hypothetical protein (macronuclear) [Paramecium tetraurelia strain d4-2]
MKSIYKFISFKFQDTLILFISHSLLVDFSGVARNLHFTYMSLVYYTLGISFYIDLSYQSKIGLNKQLSTVKHPAISQYIKNSEIQPPLDFLK